MTAPATHIFQSAARPRRYIPLIAGAGGIVERYLLREMIKPMGLALVVTLTALILERVLRLFDMVARGGGSFDAVARMAFNLTPYYLGLALPAAFFVALFIVIASMDDAEELDALYAGGFSHWRIVRPFVAMGCLFAVLSVALFGYIQPYSRYAYYEVVHIVRHGPWDARVQAGVVVNAGDGVVITADGVDATGRNLTGVLLRSPREDGGEQLISAEHGALRLASDGRRLVLTIWNGELQSYDDVSATRTARFDEMVIDRSFATAIPPFRGRGGDEREMTTGELRAVLRGDPGAPEVPHSNERLAAELHSRIARALSVPFLPLLAMTMGVAAKRQQRAIGIVLGGLILVVFQNSILLAEGLADVGAAPPAFAVWTPFTIFAGFCVWVFVYSHARPGRNVFTGVFHRLDALSRLISRAVRRMRRGRARRPRPA